MSTNFVRCRGDLEYVTPDAAMHNQGLFFLTKRYLFPGPSSVTQDGSLSSPPATAKLGPIVIDLNFFVPSNGLRPRAGMIDSQTEVDGNK